MLSLTLTCLSTTPLIFSKDWSSRFLVDWRQGGDNIKFDLFLDWWRRKLTNGWFGDDNGDGIPNGRQREPAPFNKCRKMGSGCHVCWKSEKSDCITLSLETTISNLFGNTVQNMRVGSSVNNAFLFTNYKGYDPETSTFGAQAVQKQPWILRHTLLQEGFSST